MAYKKQTFINKSTVLTDQHLNHMEDGIYENSVDIERLTREMENNEIWMFELEDGTVVNKQVVVR